MTFRMPGPPRAAIVNVCRPNAVNINTLNANQGCVMMQKDLALRLRYSESLFAGPLVSFLNKRIQKKCWTN